MTSKNQDQGPAAVELQLYQQEKWWAPKNLIRRPIRALYPSPRDRLIRRSFLDRALLDRFARGAPLPAGYGDGFDERSIEYTWAVANLPRTPGLLLDAGSALNHQQVLNAPRLRNKTLHIMTLAPEPRCYWQRGISYLFCDLREIPIRDEFYDWVVSISVLEHIGCDNVPWGAAEVENRPRDFLLVMRELRRVLKPGGTLLLTVPFGAYRHLRWLQVFDRPLLREAIEAFGPAQAVGETFYRYRPGRGWNVAIADECAASSFGAHGLFAEAIACVRLVK